ncbi:hypothetical protein [Sphingosinicella sp. BN140058]|uniref:hypothetical protein n=1 Tax=Sphingosinicella sp. BN140058 TaxID=1892855 RepID=UPI0010114DC3|nr:hypothetical protein [Sphingosinicella sp. BN140058]QAY79331.1 hypothetical protein ETR14_24400 [Sphingosinicella sp. BN140058]
MNPDFDLWRSADLARWFLFAVGDELPIGDLAITAFDGRTACVDARWASLHEVGEGEGREWAREALGEALATVRARVEHRIAVVRAETMAARAAPLTPETEITAEAVPALFWLLKSLPGVLRDGLSGDPRRVGDAEARLGEIQTRLNRSGIAVGNRLAGFAERLDGLRSEVGRQRPDRP